MANVPLIVDIDDAEAYFNSRLRPELWNAADEETKKRALLQSAFLISGAFVFTDAAYYVDAETQAVYWNTRVIAAVCEQAVWLMARDPSEIPEALFKGIVSASAGSVSATFDKSFILPWICPVAKTLIGDLGIFLDDDSSWVKFKQLAL